jgi:hypothetical protein
MPQSTEQPATPAAPHINRGWRAALLLVLAVTAARFVFIAISPVGLAADEAHYWDWSRTPEWSYYSKGPGIAQTIAASTALFGDTEFGVRFFAPLSGAALALLCGLLASMAFPTTPRIALYAAAAVLCLPIIHGLGLLMTIDPPYLVCWALACVALLAWAPSAQRSPTGACTLALAAGFGAAVGVGFLYKYTALLLVACALLYIIVDRKRLRVTPARLAPSALVSAAVIAFCTLPVVIWNAQHDWLTVRHLLGHLGLPGGDVPSAPQASEATDAGALDAAAHAASNIALYTGGQLALAGPIALLAITATIAAVRRIAATRLSNNGPAPSADALLLCLAWPIFALYLVVALFTEPEGNWPVAGWVALAALVARDIAPAMHEHRRRLRAWRAGTRRPRQGVFRRRPETAQQIVWHASLAVGAASLGGALLISPADRLPVIGELVPLHRLNQGRDLAATVAPVRETFSQSMREQGRGEPLVIAARYTSAAWLAFYLPDQPRVSSAASFRGDRASAYDVFEQTRLDRPDLVGKPAIVVGGSPEGWAESAVRLDQLTQVAGEPRRVYTAGAFLGVRRDDDTR